MFYEKTRKTINLYIACNEIAERGINKKNILSMYLYKLLPTYKREDVDNIVDAYILLNEQNEKMKIEFFNSMNNTQKNTIYEIFHGIIILLGVTTKTMEYNLPAITQALVSNAKSDKKITSKQALLFFNTINNNISLYELYMNQNGINSSGCLFSILILITPNAIMTIFH